MARNESDRSNGATVDTSSPVRWGHTEILCDPEPVQAHPRVERVLRVLHDLPARDRLSLERLAAVAGLSPSRFMHVFTRSVGMPLRRYILWLRLRRAACALAAGASVTHAAHSAGFSDAAHMTRTFRRMLGTTPARFASHACAKRARLASS